MDYTTHVSNETKSNLKMLLPTTKTIAFSQLLVKAFKHMLKFTLTLIKLLLPIIQTLIITLSVIFLYGQITKQNSHIELINFINQLKTLF
jgi:hypothetical protein